VRNIEDPNQAAKLLVDHALARFSTDNLSCMVVRFDKVALLETQKDKAIGVESDASDTAGKVSEADKIVGLTKQKIADGVPAVGVSGSNSGRGHDPIPLGDSETFKPTALKGSLDEAPEDSDAPEVTKDALPNPGSYLSPSTPDGTNDT
jgi:protein phosphatase PTC1